jgi:hypothetical protein
MVDTCPICQRELGSIKVNEHHLIPRSRKHRNKELFNSTEVIKVHEICHNAIHASISETELLQQYHTVPALLAHPNIQAFVKWVKKKPIDFYTSTKKKRI